VDRSDGARRLAVRGTGGSSLKVALTQTDKLILEPTARQLVDATSTPPFPYELDYATARKLLDDIQAGPVEKLPIDEEWITVPAAVGDARVRIITPRVVREGAVRGLDGTRIAVAGDSVGGNMATVLTLMAKDRGDVRFVQAQMYYPVTDAAMDTDSYEQFADGPYITRKAMEWFWDAYVADPAQRFEVTASPNLATIEQLRGLPPTLLLVDEADVLRDEGEA
jgi:hypothetical protein